MRITKLRYKFMSEIIPVVNKKDEIIEYRERDLVTKNDIYRISALWLANSGEEFLLAQRSFDKKHNPGKWGPAVAGTVAKDEDYLTNIVRETKEEIGIDLQKYEFEKTDKILTGAEWKFFCQWYILRADISLNEFVFPKDEVAQLKWVKKKDFERDLAKCPENYTITMAQHYEVLKKYF